jgi:DNA modification methylase
LVILLGDAALVLKDFKDESVNCVVTSPPYWALRDYKTEGQLGLETTFQEYINKLIGVFDQIKRVLTKDGTCWVVLGDTYAQESVRIRRSDKRIVDDFINNDVVNSITSKSLCLIPERFAIGMIDRGWILRNDIIWHKPNCMPSSATDRFTVDYEHIFFFVKSQRYYFKTQYETSQAKWERWGGDIIKKPDNPKDDLYAIKYRERQSNPTGEESRIKRTVWEIPTKPYPDAHFAVFPEELIKTPIIAGCPEGGTVLDPFSGSGTTLLTAHKLLRNWIGIEINPDYVQLAKKRLTPYVQQQRLEQFPLEL